MKSITLALTAFLLFFQLNSYAEPASESSIRELLHVMKMPSAVNSAREQMKVKASQIMQKWLSNKEVSFDQQTLIVKVTSKFNELIDSDFIWPNFEHSYIQIYKGAFSQAQINDLITFYKSPTGQVLALKMPVMAQQQASLIEQVSESIMSKVQAYKAQEAKKMHRK